MSSPSKRRTLLDTLTAQAARACVHLDDTRDPGTRRVGKNLHTSTELLAAERVLLDAAEAPALRQIGQRIAQHRGHLS